MLARERDVTAPMGPSELVALAAWARAGHGDIEAARAAFTEAVIRGVIRVGTHRPSRASKCPALEVSRGDAPADVLAPAERVLAQVVLDACAVTATGREVGAALRARFGPGLTGFVTDCVEPLLESRGLMRGISSPWPAVLPEGTPLLTTTGVAMASQLAQVVEDAARRPSGFRADALAWTLGPGAFMFGPMREGAPHLSALMAARSEVPEDADAPPPFGDGPLDEAAVSAIRYWVGPSAPALKR